MSLSIKADNISKISLLTPVDRVKSRTQIIAAESSTGFLKPGNTPPRRYSSPGPCPTPSEINSFQPVTYRCRRGDSEVCPASSEPVIEAQKLSSSFVQPHSNLTWRSSYTSHHTNRGAHLRKLSQQFEVPIQLVTDVSSVGTQTIPRWLNTQALRSSSRCFTTSDSSTVHQETLPMRPPRSDTGFGGVDGSGNFSTIHLQDMDISKRLLQSSCSSPQLVSWEKQDREASDTGDAARNRAQYMRNPSETISIPSCPSITLSELLPPNWGKVPQDDTSSFYPSVVNSIQPSPDCSRMELFSLVSTNKSLLAMSDSQGMKFVQLMINSTNSFSNRRIYHPSSFPSHASGHRGGYSNHNQRIFD